MASSSSVRHKQQQQQLIELSTYSDMFEEQDDDEKLEEKKKEKFGIEDNPHSNIYQDQHQPNELKEESAMQIVLYKEGKLVQCKYCESKLTQNEMQHHIELLHNEAFQCPNCEAYHNSIEELEDHMMAHQFDEENKRSDILSMMIEQQLRNLGNPGSSPNPRRLEGLNDQQHRGNRPGLDQFLRDLRMMQHERGSENQENLARGQPNSENINNSSSEEDGGGEEFMQPRGISLLDLFLKQLPRPVNKELFNILPEIKHKKPQQQNQGESSEQKKQEDDQCLICQFEYEDEEVLKMLPCFHKFHKECIKEWLQRQNACPCCRHVIE